MMGWYGGSHGSLGWLGIAVFLLLLLGLIVWLVIQLLPGTGDEPTRALGEPALEILDRRLGSGDIDLPAWQAKRNALVAAQRGEVAQRM